MCSWALDLTAIELYFEFCVFEVPHDWFGRFQCVFRLKAQLVSAISPEPTGKQNRSRIRELAKIHRELVHVFMIKSQKREPVHDYMI